MKRFFITPAILIPACLLLISPALPTPQKGTTKPGLQRSTSRKPSSTKLSPKTPAVSQKAKTPVAETSVAKTPVARPLSQAEKDYLLAVVDLMHNSYYYQEHFPETARSAHSAAVSFSIVQDTFAKLQCPARFAPAHFYLSQAMEAAISTFQLYAQALATGDPLRLNDIQSFSRDVRSNMTAGLAEIDRIPEAHAFVQDNLGVDAGSEMALSNSLVAEWGTSITEAEAAYLIAYGKLATAMFKNRYHYPVGADEARQAQSDLTNAEEQYKLVTVPARFAKIDQLARAGISSQIRAMDHLVSADNDTQESPEEALSLLGTAAKYMAQSFTELDSIRPQNPKN